MKKVLSIVLVALLLVSTTVIAVSAESRSWFEDGMISAKEAVQLYNEANETEIETHRYYFQVPNGKNGPVGVDESNPDTYGKKAPSWFHEFEDEEGVTRTSDCALYWWGCLDGPNCEDLDVPWGDGGWVGYLVEKDEAGVYYADVPASVTTIIWNNGINGGMDDTLPIYFLAAQSVNIGSEYYDPGESPLYPDGVDSFDNMIYIIDPDKVSISDYSLKQTCGGEWYFYYGNGCYGTVKGGEEDIEKNCINPDHDHSAPTYKLGDVNGDTVVDVVDATIIQKACAQIIELNDIQKLAANVCGNGVDNISVMDATRIQKFCAHICNLDGSEPWIDPEGK